jgi:hypothetical protein
MCNNSQEKCKKKSQIQVEIMANISAQEDRLEIMKKSERHKEQGK